MRSFCQPFFEHAVSFPTLLLGYIGAEIIHHEFKKKKKSFVFALSHAASVFMVFNGLQSLAQSPSNRILLLNFQTKFPNPIRQPPHSPYPPQSNPYKSLHLSLDRVYLSPVSKFTLLLRPLLLEK